MSTVRPSVVRQRVAAAITAALGASNWQEASDPNDTFGQSDGDRLDKSFAVGAVSTSATADRQTLAGGALVQTQVRVKFAIMVPAHDQVIGYDAGLDAEAAVLAAVMAARQSVALDVRYDGSERSVAEGWFTGEISLTAIHRMPLS
jgi:hypothetical protein